MHNLQGEPDVGTTITEGTANFLVNRRMNNSQQMHWSRRGVELLLQIRCTICNGTLGSGFGQEVPASQRSIPVNGGSRLAPNLAAVPRQPRAFHRLKDNNLTVPVQRLVLHSAFRIA